ncbi:MAG: cadherin-like domain-containing protein, partial [Gammaproteobacteria bacterium]|nr:cadherin-like domain-containing protein [Gammaproteobacteria bacterium]
MKRKQQKFIKPSQTKRKVLLAAAICMTFSMGSLYAACTITTVPDPATITTGQSIDFTGTVTGKKPATYSWTFSGGSPAAASTESVTVSYATAGSYTATLDGTDGRGGTCQASTSVTVNENGGGGNNPPTAVGDDYSTTKGQQLVMTAPGVLENDFDQDGDTLTAVLETGTTVNGSNVSLSADGSFTYTPNANFTGSDSFTYTAFDGTDSSLIATVNINVTDNNTAGFSINSTSRSQVAPASTKVTEQPFTTNSLYQVLAINDLGMHCGDLDTRISSILPPFNVLHSQVVLRGTATTKPRIMNEGEVELFYSAVSNDIDPILASAPVLAKDGSLYKANFWDIARQAYAPFYPSGILELFYPDGSDIVDVGLPVPDVERFYLEDGFLAAGQQAMPGILDPLADNAVQPFHEHIGTLPFFTGFAFGYTSDVNWFEAAGIPMAVYDDTGRKNPYPLMRVQAKVGQDVVASVDAVVPISGEAECQRCHASVVDGGNGAATQELIDNGITVYDSIDDPADDVPFEASIEWASDLNIIALHDLKHNTSLSQGFDANGKANNPVVCQVCHYTPALDLAQFGPLGPENDNVDPIVLNDGAIVIASLANGRDQAKNKSMSNVMHNNHANVTDL